MQAAGAVAAERVADALHSCVCSGLTVGSWAALPRHTISLCVSPSIEWSEPPHHNLSEIVLALRRVRKLQRLCLVTQLPTHSSWPRAPEPFLEEALGTLVPLAVIPVPLLGEIQTRASPEVQLGSTPWFLKADRPSYFQIATLPLSNWVALAKLFGFCFPILKKGGKNGCLVHLEVLKETTYR